MQIFIHLHIPNLSYDEFPTFVERDDSVWDINRLFICLLYANDECFVKGILLIAEERPNDLYNVFTCTKCFLWQLEKWLHPSVYETFQRASEKLESCNQFGMELVLKKFRIFENNCQYWKGKKYSNLMNVIDAIMPDPKFQHRKFTELFNQGQCVEVIIDWDVNIIRRHLHNHSALYHAVAHNHPTIILKLLQKGSYIGSARNLFDSNACATDLEILEEHFNDCITKCIIDDRYIEIDLKNLLNPPNVSNEPCAIFVNEMKAIELIGERCEQRHLLIHPLIATFVLMKWNCVAFVFHIQFILYIVFIIFTVGFIWCTINDISSNTRMIFATGTIFMSAYHAIRKIAHQIYANCYQELNFRDQFHNYLICANLTVTVTCVALLFIGVSPYYRPIVATVCIVSMAGRLFVLAGSLFWSFAQYYVMFLDVAKSSLQSLQLCIILLPTFCFSFYLLLRSETLKTMSESQLNGQTINLNFSFLRSAVLKIVAMMAGEFDVGNSNFDVNYYSTCLFLGFVFFIMFVYMNFMNGLAVRNTHKIQNDAEATSMGQRVKLLAHIERLVSQARQQKYHFPLIGKLFKWLTRINTIDALQRPLNTKIYIAPDNRVLILRKDYRISKHDSNDFQKNGSYLYDWTNYFFFSPIYFRVHSIFVQDARRIIALKEIKQKEQYEKRLLKREIKKLKRDLEQIKQIVKQNK